MKKSKRKRFFVDPEVQTAIFYRIVIYWIACILFILLPLTFFSTAMDPEVHIVAHFLSVVTRHWPILLMMFLALPFALYDVGRFSNRFVGPIYRVRQDLKAFEKTGKIRDIKFREGDYWQDLAGQLNVVTGRLRELEAEMDSQKENEMEAVSR